MAIIRVTLPDCGGCCDPCVGLPATLTVTVAGVAACGCVQTNFGEWHNVTIASGINGVHTVTFNGGTNTWENLNIGTVDLIRYSDACVTVTDTYSESVALRVSCASILENYLWVRVTFNAANGGVFEVRTVIDTVANNDLACGAGGFLFTPNVAGGTVLVERP